VARIRSKIYWYVVYNKTLLRMATLISPDGAILT
jgi:hypothetical protein